MQVSSVLRPLFGGLMVAIAIANGAASQAEPPGLILKPGNSSGIYGLGDKVSWAVTDPSNGLYDYVIRKNNLEPIQSGKVDLSSGKASIETTLNEPAMLYLEIKTPGSTPDHVSAGAAVAPKQLQPCVPRPADFDLFWESKIKLLNAIPVNPILTARDSDHPDVDYATLQMDHINGGHVYGQIARPHREGKFPAMVIFQWASPPYPLQKGWVTGHAASGWLTLNIGLMFL
jgi:cephalosporin-C deacetylase